MSSSVNLQETYLYRINALSNALNKMFDKVLRTHTDVTLSQLMVLLTIAENPGINQRQIAHYLEISAVAVKRQTDIIKRARLVEVVRQKTRGESLKLTRSGQHAIEVGLRALEQYAFKIFGAHNRSLNLMQHINVLLDSTKEVLEESQARDGSKRITRRSYANSKSS